MGFESYISESEAATLAGVGITTLRRFAEAGYFKIETESDGLKLYARSDLERVFGIKSKPVAAQPIPSFPPPQFPAWTPPKETISPESNGAPVSAVSAEEESAIEEPAPKPAVEMKAAPIVEKTAEKSEPAVKPEPSVKFERAAKVEPEVKAAPQPVAKAVEIAPQVHSGIEVLDRELQKQRTITEMHERLLQIREEEIRSLKDEREWLRLRIEKLEEKSSRDQVLLLSETQTIKTLISIQEQRRSPVRLALEWLGFITPPPAENAVPRSAIDITQPEMRETKKAA